MEKDKGKEVEESTCLWMIPEECLADILELTSPPDVCRLSLASQAVRGAADSNAVWKKFLPCDYQLILAGSASPIPDFQSLKDLFAYLSRQPLLIDEGRKAFSLDKWSGKKCYFLGARDLNIAQGRQGLWEWISLPESRFPEVGMLEGDFQLDIWGTIRAGLLSSQTSYTAYIVYKLGKGYWRDDIPVEVSVEISGVISENRLAFLHPDDKLDDELEFDDDELFVRSPELREGGWFAIKLGDFLTENEDDYIKMKLLGPQCRVPKHGLVVEGIEIRPTNDKEDVTSDVRFVKRRRSSRTVIPPKKLDAYFWKGGKSRRI